MDSSSAKFVGVFLLWILRLLSGGAAVKEIYTPNPGWGVFRENKFKSHKIKYEYHNT
jgi:hypothetical protein